MTSSLPKSATKAVKASRRRKDALSTERIVAAAIEILTTQGEAALTFRALAGKLNTGAGALYWHVADKDALLQLAASHVVRQALEAARPEVHEPHRQICRLALAAYDAMKVYPWLGAQLSRQPWQMGVTELFEHLGQQVQRSGVTDKLNVTSALVYYLLGLAAQHAAAARLPGNTERADFLAQTARAWEELDAAHYPFMRQVAGELAAHDDRQQFLAGIHLILRGMAEVKTEG